VTVRDVVVLGSTGSIGTQALDVAAGHPERLRVTALSAAGADPGLLARQAVEHRVATVALARAERAEDFRAAWRAAADAAGGGLAEPELLVGADAATELAGRRTDTVLNGLTGSLGLAPTLAALDSGATLALANKESLVAGGPLVKDRAKPGQIVPVDSEHSALAQCLRGGSAAEVRKLVLTASGGPFRGRTRDQLHDVTPQQALAHPTWQMGPVITINSATLVNKGLEVIEAHLLFDVPYERIGVVVHPQSLVHSMVEFVDGSTLAQASPPDMRLPIALALAWPDRLDAVAAPCDWTTASTWEFLPLDEEAFPAIRMAREVGVAGGTAPAVYNAANEVCVEAFMAGALRFTGILDTVQAVVETHLTGGLRNSPTLDEVLDAETWARRRARELTSRSATA
jgi:1-deoxy-D-xylulose-5-phosphate reductoisomerase